MIEIKQDNNVVLILDGQEMIKKIKEKYGEYPVVSEKGKRLKEKYARNKSPKES
jgi:hypothetical protein